MILKTSEKPALFSMGKSPDRRRFQELVRTKRPKLIDTLAEQKEELKIVKDPRSATTPPRSSKTSAKEGVWAYFPWRNTAVRILEKKNYELLRTSRNRELISAKEQKQLAEAKIGIAGLNVGNPAALCLALEGGGHCMKFADNDTLSLSNLNRFRAGLLDLGLNKALLSARQVYEINPYADIETWQNGIVPETIEKFLAEPKLDVLIEETDNLKIKIALRKAARFLGIPVVMVTGNSENVILDVERYDLNKNLPLLNGYLAHKIIAEIEKGGVISAGEKIAMARDFMGKKFLDKKLLHSFSLVGTELAGIPQIAESSFGRGAVAAFATRRIITGKEMPSGRFALKLSEIAKNRLSK